MAELDVEPVELEAVVALEDATVATSIRLSTSMRSTSQYGVAAAAVSMRQCAIAHVAE